MRKRHPSSDQLQVAVNVVMVELVII